MALNCLTCQGFQRTNSDREADQQPPVPIKDKVGLTRLDFGNGERNWSGNLGQQPREKPRNFPADRKGPRHRRLYTTGAVAFETEEKPKLLRSSGMRRDWSFEDMRALNAGSSRPITVR